jgi:23S rRNA (guanosine2251-2'-O)-methyltransferase
MIESIIQRAKQIALPIERLSALELSRISKHGKQDQGVALDVQAPLHIDLKHALSTASLDRPIFLMDGLNTPANLGMVIRSVWASGASGVILPREGCAPLNPLAVKASAGVAIHAAVWHCQSSLEAVQLLTEHQIPIFGLAGEASRSLYDSAWPQRAAWVIGNESIGMSAEVRAHLTDAVSLPMAGHVESLNAAAAASVVAFELSRQRGEDA